ESGMAFMAARKQEFKETFETTVPLDCLPPVAEAVPEIRNPAVVRALTELRRVVNAVIREYGKPDEVHIELARDLKQTRPERERRWKRARQQETRRKDAAAEILKDGGPSNPSASDIEKMMLAMECRLKCPYTGRCINHTALMSGEVQVEHIIPFSRSLDDSYANKTLCFAQENKGKGNRTPWEHYGAAGHTDWDAILDRVAKFDGPLAKEKLRRFQMRAEEVDEMLTKFSERQLNDTRYASKLAAKYLAVLFGGLWDGERRQRIFVTGGQVTAYLRRLWGLNQILSGGDRKARESHRHHALDAIVVGVTGPAWVKALADAADRANAQGRRRFASIEAPWQGFVDDTRRAVTTFLVSHRPDRSIGGGFHDEKLYGQRRGSEGQPTVVVRKPVTGLSASEIDRIVDPAIRERVRLQVGIVGGDAKKLIEDKVPVLPTRDGRTIPIRCVRVEIGKQVRRIGVGPRARWVMGGDNQHFEVYGVLDKSGMVKGWTCAIVSKAEAANRVRQKVPVVCKDHGPNTRFEFTIAKNDILEIGPPEERRLVVAKGLEGDTRVKIFDIDDARAENSPGAERRSINVLMRDLRARKVAVTPLGDVIPCRD
ncbi:MAG: type II CRISPR RNA-guided endonuclease Cas9, partial [Acidobacteria bacterium]|nr:type II CRISPR RNA-guided endonuclease Cas9 [Acidobacteriota bacterium]